MRATLFQQLRKTRAESAKVGVNRNKQILDTSELVGRQSFYRKRRLDDPNNSVLDQTSSFRFPEKEKYEQELKYLKNNLHSLESENIKLKTKIHQLEDNQLKQEKMLQELDRVGPAKTQLLRTLTYATALNALKKELNNMKMQMQKKDQELVNMKKNQRYTQMNELQIERTAFQEETVRLRQQIEQLFQASLYNLQQNNVEQAIQERLFQLITQLQEHVIQKSEMQKVIERLKKECLKYRSSQIEQEFRSKKEIKRLIDQLKEEACNSQKDSNKETSQQTKPDELQLLTDLMFAKQEAQAKQNEIDGLNRIIIDLETYIKDLNAKQKSETQEITPQSQRIETSTKSKVIKIQIPVFATEIMQEVALPIKNSIVIQEQIQQQVKQPPRRRIVPVKFDEIKNIGETLKYRLMAMDVNIAQLDEYLFEGDSMSYRELKEKLRLYPFNLTSEESLLVSRYIMESENDVYELLDTASNFNPYIRSVLRRIVSNYKLEIVKNQLFHSEKLKDVLTRFKPFILSNIKQLYGKDCIRVNKQQFNEALMSLNIELNSFELDYLIVQGILESKGIESLNYEEMLKYEMKVIPDQQLSFLLTEINNQQNQKAEMSVIEECPEKLSEQDQQEQVDRKQEQMVMEQQKNGGEQYVTFDKYVSEQFDSDSEESKQEILTSAFNLEQ
ncbi:unnamed protein product (macronuclear) [Paramecium tetraurelia]|uniref:Uncharacterized protein n=1 Tax=Paramecium tetraurelia TaxID=5888 RepID=A0CP69_PARTE|nr:uncharacterized protein GSPATT00008977001 [Paramecium tetraurelia]CAK72586.1 unnamed protein product [Paramecium tetraurelia]|eukprot:XP_001439983.1 hypothetical protein (macronuclear) [Paramecium tetraurelia strain d4-2]